VVGLFVIGSSLQARVSFGRQPRNAHVILQKSSSLTAEVLNISDNGKAEKIDFQTPNPFDPAWNVLAPQYVKMKVQFSAINWRLRLATDNFSNPLTPPVLSASSTPSEIATFVSAWGYALGGLRGDVSGAKVPMGWRASTSPVTGVSPVISKDPKDPSSGWTFVKDKNDLDDPKAVGDQSFLGADASPSYCNVASGNYNFTRIKAPLDSTGSVLLPNKNDSFGVFFNADFSGVSMANYSTVLLFELINE